MTSTMPMGAQLRGWVFERNECMANESSSSRWAQRVQNSDDHAAQLVQDVLPIIEAAEAMMHRCWDAFGDQATGYSCSEIESLAALANALHNDPHAFDEILAMHAEGDDPEDDHYIGGGEA